MLVICLLTCLRLTVVVGTSGHAHTEEAHSEKHTSGSTTPRLRPRDDYPEIPVSEPGAAINCDDPSDLSIGQFCADTLGPMFFIEKCIFGPGRMHLQYADYQTTGLRPFHARGTDLPPLEDAGPGTSGPSSSHDQPGHHYRRSLSRRRESHSPDRDEVDVREVYIPEDDMDLGVDGVFLGNRFDPGDAVTEPGDEFMEWAMHQIQTNPAYAPVARSVEIFAEQDDYMRTWRCPLDTVCQELTDADLRTRVICRPDNKLQYTHEDGQVVILANAQFGKMILGEHSDSDSDSSSSVGTSSVDIKMDISHASLSAVMITIDHKHVVSSKQEFFAVKSTDTAKQRLCHSSWDLRRIDRHHCLPTKELTTFKTGDRIDFHYALKEFTTVILLYFLMALPSLSGSRMSPP